MSVTLEVLQEMWEKDSKMDRDNLHEESLNIPSLHAKYFELYNTIFLLRKKQSSKERISVMNGMSILVGKQTQTFILRIHFQRR